MFRHFKPIFCQQSTRAQIDGILAKYREGSNVSDSIENAALLLHELNAFRLQRWCMPNCSYIDAKISIIIRDLAIVEHEKIAAAGLYDKALANQLYDVDFSEERWKSINERLDNIISWCFPDEDEEVEQQYKIFNEEKKLDNEYWEEVHSPKQLISWAWKSVFRDYHVYHKFGRIAIHYLHWRLSHCLPEQDKNTYLRFLNSMLEMSSGYGMDWLDSEALYKTILLKHGNEDTVTILYNSFRTYDALANLTALPNKESQISAIKQLKEEVQLIKENNVTQNVEVRIGEIMSRVCSNYRDYFEAKVEKEEADSTCNNETKVSVEARLREWQVPFKRRCKPNLLQRDQVCACQECLLYKSYGFRITGAPNNPGSLPLRKHFGAETLIQVKPGYGKLTKTQRMTALEVPHYILISNCKKDRNNWYYECVTCGVGCKGG